MGDVSPLLWRLRLGQVLAIPAFGDLYHAEFTVLRYCNEGPLFFLMHEVGASIGFALRLRGGASMGALVRLECRVRRSVGPSLPLSPSPPCRFVSTSTSTGPQREITSLL
jgi:hypothetical protein